MKKEIIQLLDNEPPLGSEDEFESANDQNIRMDDDIIGVNDLDKF